MSSLYCALPTIIDIGVIVLLAAVVVQTFSVVSGFRCLWCRADAMPANVLEITVLLQQMMLFFQLTELQLGSSANASALDKSVPLQWLLFLLLAVFTGFAINRQNGAWPLLTPLAALLTLPRMSGAYFPVLSLTASVFWLLRSTGVWFLRRAEQKRRLTTRSIKEAVECMDSGLLFYSEQAQEEGKILLQNSKMQELEYLLAGQMQTSGTLFYERLKNGSVQPACQRQELGEQIIYRIPNGQSWTFEKNELAIRGKHYALLSASDATLHWQAAQQLWQQKTQLEHRNQELQSVLSNLENLCRAEEMIRAKSRVHDVLGQRISLLLRAMREQREPDEKLLADFAKGLPRELIHASQEQEYSLEMLAQIFKKMDVTLHLEGDLPTDSVLARVYFEVAAEAVTNSVRHGYASEVWICQQHMGRIWTMDITDNGISSPDQVEEGGGLQGMRRKIEQIGGRFSYTLKPQFCIHAEVLEGAEG